MPTTYYISETQEKAFRDLLDTYSKNGSGSENARIDFLNRAINELDTSLMEAQDLLDHFDQMVEVVDTDALVVVPSNENDLSRIPICLPIDLYDRTVEVFLDVSGHSTLKEFYFDSYELSKGQKDVVKSNLEDDYGELFENNFVLERVITQFPYGIQKADFTGRESIKEIRSSFLQSFSSDMLSVEKSLTTAVANTLLAISSMDSKSKIGFYVVLAEILHKLAKEHMQVRGAAGEDGE